MNAGAQKHRGFVRRARDQARVGIDRRHKTQEYRVAPPGAVHMLRWWGCVPFRDKLLPLAEYRVATEANGEPPFHHVDFHWRSGM